MPRRSIFVRSAVLGVALVVGLAAGASPGAAVDSTPCDANPFTEELTSVIAERWPSNGITAEVEDLRTGCRYSLAPERRQSTASVIKISIMAATLLRAQDEGRELSDWERRMIGPMIWESDNPTASALWVSLGGSPGMQSYLDRFGLEETRPVSPKWGASITSASDQVDLIKQLIIGGGPLEADGRATARDFLLGVVPSQQWGATAGVPPTWAVPMKNGFYPSRGWAWRINTVGLVEDMNGPAWAVAVLTDGWSDDEPGIEAAEFIVAEISRAMLSERKPDFGASIRPV